MRDAFWDALGITIAVCAALIGLAALVGVNYLLFMLSPWFGILLGPVDLFAIIFAAMWASGDY